jgi:hypothetical protein
MVLIGATLYAFEIPNYFNWIDKRTLNLSGLKLTFTRTIMAMLFFNPLWIARHLFFIKLFSFQAKDISLQILEIAFWSFLANIFISFIGNFVIQNKISFKWRFMASAILSSLMAIYYALSETLFS